MTMIKIFLDEETYRALTCDADRYLRPADWHAKALLRQALGLAFPYPPAPTGPAVDPGREHAA